MLITSDIQDYPKKLSAFKKLLDDYSVADLNTMIYEIGTRESGDCTYPALQTLIALMELVGKLLTGEEKERAFLDIFERMGGLYTRAKGVEIYGHRHTIAHKTLAKGNIKIYKGTDMTEQEIEEKHLKEDILVLKRFFEDFLALYKKLFKEELQNKMLERNLQSVFGLLGIPWNNKVEEISRMSATVMGPLASTTSIKMEDVTKLE